MDASDCRLMAEPALVVDSREHLWYLLTEASQLEHMIMCQYLYATFSLKEGVGDGLTDAQAAAVSRWRRVLEDISVEEMLHLALVANVMAAIGAAPTVGRPNFPQRSGYFPPSVQLDLLPFGEAALTHFLYLERPEGMERLDAEGFVPMAPPHEPLAVEELLPRMQDFATVGHLYRGISHGLSHLVERFGERAVFVGAASAQTRAELLRWPQLVAVTDLESAQAAVEEIIDQGEGARGDWSAAHYGRFLDMWSEYRDLKNADPSFEPARPVQAAFVRQPYDVVAPQPLVTDQAARAVAELFNLAYEAVLQTLTRLFTHTDETDTQLETLAGSAIGLMAGVLRPLGSSLTTMPVGDEHPGRTTGPAFEVYYPMGNFVPWRDSAWAVLTERVRVLADRCDAVSRRGDVPGTIADVAATAQAIAADLAAHVPSELLAVDTELRTS
jgi:Ferritin-like